MHQKVVVSLWNINSLFKPTQTLWNGTLLAELGTPLNEVGSLSDYFNDKEMCVGDGDKQPRIALKPTHVVTRNMKVVVGKCMNVTVGAPINKSETMIAGETLDHLAFFFGFSLDGFIVVAKGSEQVLNQSSVIETDTVLKLCHNVSVSGEQRESFLIEHGSQLSQVESLSPFWNEQYGIVDGNSETRIVYEPSHLVTMDMSIEIIKKHCVSIGKPLNTVVYVFPNTTIKELEQEHQISFDDFIVVDSETEQVLNQSSMIEKDTVLKLCHSVSVSGDLNQTWIVEHGTKLESISELSGFWNSYFILFNTTNSSQVYTKETLVECDIVVTIIESTRVVVDITPTDKVNETEVIKSISEIVGGDPSIVGVDVVRNEEGQVIGIIIIVEDENTANTIVDIINGMDTGTGCAAGVLCCMTNAYVERKNLSDAHTSFASTTLLLLSFFLVNHFM